MYFLWTTQLPYMPELHLLLMIPKVGSILRLTRSGKRIRVTGTCGADDFLSFNYIRKDGQRDKRHPVGFSCRIGDCSWFEVESEGNGE